MSINLGAKVRDAGWSEEFDCIPLRSRLKMLHSREHQWKEGHFNSELVRTANCSRTVFPAEDPPIHQASDSDPTFQFSDNSSSGDSVDYGLDRNFEKSSVRSHKMPVSAAEADIKQLNNPVDVLQEKISDIHGNVLEDHLMDSSSANVQATEVKHEMLCQFDDALDNVLLKERRKLLLSRKLMRSSRSNSGEQNNGGLPKAILQCSESDSILDTQIAKYRNPEVNGCNNLASENATDGTSHTAIKCSPSTAVSLKSKSFALSADCKSFGKHTMIDASTLASSVLPPLSKVKDEPLDADELCFERSNIKQNSFIGQTLTLKTEPGISDFIPDELDHMPLIDRVKLLSCEVPSLAVFKNPACCKKDVASALDLGNDVLESVKPVSISWPRKKRRTATDSVETALEEDAPGLLRILLDRGVSSEEIKLYGEEDADDALDDSINEDGFAELEAVISQSLRGCWTRLYLLFTLSARFEMGYIMENESNVGMLFSQRQTFLKFPLVHTKGLKISYCLSCLLSLVEQTRYLRNRKWPVEWGWCRDLQSFIFVFHRHNRIVLERPEYGYATYFFELLNYLPVAWQIKRLVTAMKLTGCGRITVIENKPLVVGEDLSEGEAQVLAEYGWTPNTGLGTMLHYCDRVVHDRKQELDSSEWRMKIGRQLMNGYNGGNIVAKDLPKRLPEYQDPQNIQVKDEEWSI